MKKINLTDKIDASKEILFDYLAKKGVKKVEVSFDGGGDDGQINSIAIDGKYESKITSDKLVGVYVVDCRRFDSKTNTFVPVFREASDLEDVLTSLCYEALETVAPGWENNEGAEGFFDFDVKKRKLTLSFGERITEVNYIKYAL